MKNSQYLKVMSIIEERTPEVNEAMKSFVSECVLIYAKKEEGFSETDENIVVSYQQALDNLTRWLKMVQSADVFYNQGEWTSTTLLLPHCCSVSVSANIAFEGVERGENFVLNDNLFETPIGTMSDFTYRCITEIADNPVKMFYSFLSIEVRKAHLIIADRLGEERDGILNDKLLKEAGLYDVLGISKLDTCVRNIEDFFKINVTA